MCVVMVVSMGTWWCYGLVRYGFYHHSPGHLKRAAVVVPVGGIFCCVNLTLDVEFLWEIVAVDSRKSSSVTLSVPSCGVSEIVDKPQNITSNT